jgi:hypothetical protein
MKAIIEHSREIFATPAMLSRSDRLDARLFDRVEHRARLLSARNKTPMHGRIVAS